MRMAAITFDGALLIRDSLKRSRMSSGRRVDPKISMAVQIAL